MTFSSLTKVRSKSFNKFQFIHRLSIPFVICLLLHPMTHVLKEQINIDRHDPESCDNRTLVSFVEITSGDNMQNYDATISRFDRILEQSTNLMENNNKAMLRNNNNSGKFNQQQQINKDNKEQNSDDRQESIKSMNGQNNGHEFVLTELDGSSITKNNFELPEARRQLSNGIVEHSDNAKMVSDHQDDDDDDRPIASSMGLQTDNLKALEKSIHDKTTPEPESKLEPANLVQNSRAQLVAATTTTTDQHHRNGIISIQQAYSSGLKKSVDFVSDKRRRVAVDDGEKYVDGYVDSNEKNNNNNTSNSNDYAKTLSVCLDAKPLFVAQSSICWLVLAMGLPCYLIDLFLRKWRRSKSSIQLLGFRSDCEGNLIELILSNNHKRFEHWQPGQFIYLNCPQIAHFEWHPFTISSMDNMNGQFTLHIKTAGDWTSELRKKLSFNQASAKQNMTSEDHVMQQPSQFVINQLQNTSNNAINSTCDLAAAVNGQYAAKNNGFDNLANNCAYIQSMDFRLSPSNLDKFKDHQQYMISPILCNQISCNLNEQQNQQQLYCNKQTHSSINMNFNDAASNSSSKLDLFIDGPFHSPFERLLEQEVSVCIANGVGWTAFSSVFHNLINNLYLDHDPNDWWSKWRNFAISKNRLMSKKSQSTDCFNESLAKSQFKPSKYLEYNTQKNLPMISHKFVRNSTIQAQIHMMIIVPNIDQLKPFFLLALSYFKRFCQREYQSIDLNSLNNPIREISAFLTRGKFGYICLYDHNMDHRLDTNSQIIFSSFRLLSPQRGLRY